MNAVEGLRASAVEKSFGAAAVLTGVDLEVADGSLTAVLGPSGCGKTTLLRVLAGFERADAGGVVVGGRPVAGPGTHLAPERRRIGFVPQEGALFPHLDLAANVGFGLPRRRRAARVGELLDLLGLAGLERRLPHQLSGGQQRRVALARALAPEPAVILLDEPFDALDAGLRREVRTEVRAALTAIGATALLVTHDQEEALSLADQVAVMRDGAIVQAASPQALYMDPVDAELARFVGEAIFLDGVRAGGGADTALGRVRLRGDAGGRGDALRVMLRPEQVALGPWPGDGDGGVGAEVHSVTFFGHDALAVVEPHGAAERLRVRLLGNEVPAVGQTVSLAVRGTALPLGEAAQSAKATAKTIPATRQ